MKKLIIFSISIILILLIIIIYCVSNKTPSNTISNNNIQPNNTNTDISTALDYTLKSQLELNDNFVFSSTMKNNDDTVMTYTYKEDFTVQFTLAENGSIKSFSIFTKTCQDKQPALDLLLCLLDKNVLILTQEEKYFIIAKAFNDEKPVYIRDNLIVTVNTNNFYMLGVTKKS